MDFENSLHSGIGTCAVTSELQWKQPKVHQTLAFALLNFVVSRVQLLNKLTSAAAEHTSYRI